jgi:hypothetical protein
MHRSKLRKKKKVYEFIQRSQRDISKKITHLTTHKKKDLFYRLFSKDCRLRKLDNNKKNDQRS